MYPEVTIEHPDIDMLCINEGEYPMLELCNALGSKNNYNSIANLWVKNNGEIKKNTPREKLSETELGDLPFADRGMYKKYKHFQNYPFQMNF